MLHELGPREIQHWDSARSHREWGLDAPALSSSCDKLNYGARPNNLASKLLKQLDLDWVLSNATHSFAPSNDLNSWSDHGL